jgi:hypothetical protein
VSGSEKRNYPLGDRGADIGGQQREPRIKVALLAASYYSPLPPSVAPRAIKCISSGATLAGVVLVPTGTGPAIAHIWPRCPNFPEVELNQTHNQMSCIVLCMTNRSHALHRLRAIQCEQRAREAPDAASKREWEELAVEWHLMANLAAAAAGEISQMEIGWQ